MLAAEIRTKPLQMLVFARRGRLMSDFKSDFQANPGSPLDSAPARVRRRAARAEGRIGQRKCRAAAE
jgi:hypothetical protein